MIKKIARRFGLKTPETATAEDASKIVDLAERRRLREQSPAKPKSKQGVNAIDVMLTCGGGRVVPAEPIGPTLKRGLTGGDCRVCGQPLPRDDQGYLNLWVHRCFGTQADSTEEIRPTPPSKPLVIEYPAAYPLPPLQIDQGVTIADIEKFVTKTVAELESHVAAVNAGRNSTIGHLVDEKVRHLQLCGVRVDIEIVVEPDLKPLHIDPPDWDFKPKKAPEIKHFKVGLSDAEVEELFASLGISRGDDLDPSQAAQIAKAWSRVAGGVYLSEDRIESHIQGLVEWLKKCAEIQARTKWMREVFVNMTEDERLQWLDGKVSSGVRLTEPIDWTKNAKPPVTQTWRPTKKELESIREKVGKRGGVFCWRCYLPMQFATINGGYDWYCGHCGLVRHYRYDNGETT